MFFQVNHSLLKLNEIKSASSRWHCRLTEALAAAWAPGAYPVVGKETVLSEFVQGQSCMPRISSWNPAALPRDPFTDKAINRGHGEISACGLPNAAMLKKQRVSWPE